ncbi:hypothetical protein [Kitasatospora sp. NPDC058046]|uniref:hypothetical protein n=1 Tax=Kitasatospora sp. NPDC058046 TaxID=3346312 RepID=UPI0036DEE311
MARELRALFGSNNQALNADEAFTNRQAQWEAVASALTDHLARTADRLTRVIDSALLPADLTDMALYYRAKAHRGLGRGGASRQGMQQVAVGTTRLAPAARRGLARQDGDFPTTLAAAQNLGWAGRRHRVLGDLWWVHAEMDQAAAYQAARTDAEQHAVARETATSQAQLAFVRAFTAPERADDGLDSPPSSSWAWTCAPPP